MSRFLALSSTSKLRLRGKPYFLCLVAVGAVLSLLPSAMAQTFSLSMSPFNFDAIDPGGTDSATVTVNGTSGTVDLACQATSQQPVAVSPACTVSPTSVSVPGDATITVNTVTSGGTATPSLYLVTVTGTGPTPPALQQSQFLTVLSVAAQYTITVAQAVSPSTVAAGINGIGTISVNPLNGYTGTVTLSCASITPLVVTYPPYCSFQPASVTVNGASGTSQITIHSSGPASTHPNPDAAQQSLSPRSSRYAFWLTLPILTFTGFGAAAGGRRSRKAWILLAFFVLGASALLMPACQTVTTTPLGANQTTGTTPNNTYTFTLSGVDGTGNPASNTGSSSAAPTVTLTVN